MLTDLLFISFVRSSSKYKADEVQQKHGAHSCQDNNVFSFSDVGKITENLSEVYFVWCHEEISTKCR